MSDPQRLFVGVKIAIASAEELRATAARLAKEIEASELGAIRWVAPARYHVTLKFLDWVRPEAFFGIRDAVGTAIAGAGALRFRPSKLGAFPSLEKPRVLWVGVESPEPLGALASTIDSALAPLGFAKEEREFHPHITLGRTRGEKFGDLSSLVVDLGPEQIYSTTQCRSVCLFESDLKTVSSSEGGAEYKVQWEWPLGTSQRT